MGTGIKLGLVSCTKSKMNFSCKAYEMYSPSSLFSKACQYAIRNYDRVVILSAKYGLLLPNDEIEPYDLTLKTMKRQQRKEWANKVFKQIGRRLGPNKIARAYFHAGREYREHLIPMLQSTGIKCVVPLEGLAFGQQLAWYNTKRQKYLVSHSGI